METISTYKKNLGPKKGETLSAVLRRLENEARHAEGVYKGSIVLWSMFAILAATMPSLNGLAA